LLARCALRREDVARIVATGYGRNLIHFADRKITEISCHARGARHGRPETRTVIEIGGQDSKLIRLDESGAVRDFAMNDRCAAGTGRFLEVVATRLEASLVEMGAMAESCRDPAAISSMCVVFAETEIVGLMAAGETRSRIAAGVQRAIAGRVAAMAGRTIDPPVVFAGGVALQPGMAQALEAALGLPVETAQEPLYTGALGAALLAAEL